MKPILEKGEKAEAAKIRVLKQAEDSVVNMALQMAEPERVKLVWQEIGVDSTKGVDGMITDTERAQ